jgi:glycerol-3-phosphate dehydrogenase
MKREIGEPNTQARVFETFDLDKILDDIDPSILIRLSGRYGSAAPHLLQRSHERVAGTPNYWTEIEWALENEAVCHLDDLLVRRLRFGIILPDGGQSLFPRLKPLCKRFLGWSGTVWRKEAARYLSIWRDGYSLPPD